MVVVMVNNKILLCASGEKVIVPVLLEVNFGPDNTRLVTAFPDFYNDVFSTLFLHDIADHLVTPL